MYTIIIKKIERFEHVFSYAALGYADRLNPLWSDTRYGKIVRDDEGNVVRVEMGEEEDIGKKEEDGGE